VAGLQAGGYPDIKNANIDRSDNDCGPDHNPFRAPAVWDNDSDAVDDYLQEQLYLDTPPEY
jgi:hypothetical protein